MEAIGLSQRGSVALARALTRSGTGRCEPNFRTLNKERPENKGENLGQSAEQFRITFSQLVRESICLEGVIFTTFTTLINHYKKKIKKSSSPSHAQC